LRYGGNTSCVEVRINGHIYIFDCGTGFRVLGKQLLKEYGKNPIHAHIFLSHFHWDHIQGIPFFRPLFQDHAELHFFTSTTLGPLRERLEGQMTRPYFPVSLERLRAPRTFCEAQGSVRRGRVDIQLFPLNPPNGATGYRIHTPAGTIVYATDAEHGNPELDRVLRKYSEGADVLIYDAQYTPEEYEHFRGWGHSTWLEAARAARDAKVGKLILFHHDPARTDAQNLKLQDDARRAFENTDMAEEGRVIRLGRSASAAR
jgi:phosphoribosyl 1,2-cyclic phosphodiesterase